jgi:ubiquitin C-terminal hydrolase
VDYPLCGLDMREHAMCYAEEKEPVYYDLYAVSNHFGGLNGGHYTATCLNSIDK